MGENDEDEQHSEQSSRHDKEVHRRHLLHVIFQEWSPALRWRPTVPAYGPYPFGWWSNRLDSVWQLAERLGSFDRRLPGPRSRFSTTPWTKQSEKRRHARGWPTACIC